MMSIRLTGEQNEVVHSGSPRLVVNAFAGTGKTSTLVAYAEHRPNLRLLYIAFNSGVAAEARARFPANVDCRTSHSLAYAKFGYMYKVKLGSPRARDISDHLQTVMSSAHMGEDAYRFALSVLQRLTAFFSSDCQEPDAPALSPPSAGSLAGAATNQAITLGAVLVWAAMRDTNNAAVQMPHDGYLKLYQLSKPDLSRYDIILLDEAQDTNPCVLSIVKAQTCAKVVVGDRHQGIYGFRGAINAMTQFDGDHLSLTSSFRFGSEIAQTANKILGAFCGESLKVKGMGQPRADDKSFCNISRTNAGLFGTAVEILKGNETMHFVGGVRGYGFEAIEDTWRLKSQSAPVRDAFLKRFRSIGQLEEYAESVEDKELLSRINIVDKYGSSIPGLVQKLTMADTPAQTANKCLTTAHKSKGLEWASVKLHEDFPEMLVGGLPRTSANCSGTGEDPLSVEEANLIYVAATRAKAKLIRNSALNDFMQQEQALALSP